MLKRFLDLVVASIGLVLTGPLILLGALLVWLQDYHSPFYLAPRVGRNGQMFKMVKLRSMVINADKTGVDSTGANDRRITRVGHMIRRFKLDELTQLWNVLKGEMSVVGPRPNVKKGGTELYTEEEKKLLLVRPGITDFASIVFADEGEILRDKEDPDLSYNQLIRPWKSRLAILNIEKDSLWIDLRVIALTAIAVVSRKRALRGIHALVVSLTDDADLRRVTLRQQALEPIPPPGSSEIVQSL